MLCHVMLCYVKKLKHGRMEQAEKWSSFYVILSNLHTTRSTLIGKHRNKKKKKIKKNKKKIKKYIYIYIYNDLCRKGKN